jgi:opacity protein-like surface antigen
MNHKILQYKSIRNYAILSLIGFLIISIPLKSQVYSDKAVGKKQQAEIDSLKSTPYPYALPIWGEKATQKGFTLPLSAGLSAQYFWSKSDIIIDNLSVGFNDGPMYNLDGIVRFDDARATAASLTFRPDVWVFPFLNVYGILGKSQASTDVGFGVWIPDSTGMAQEVLTQSILVDFNTTTFGFGFTPTIGVGGGFLALDMNWAWTDVPQLEKPARSFVFGPRFGKSFKLKKPGSNIAVWVGGFRVELSGKTNGSLDLSEVFEGDGEVRDKVDEGINKVGDAQEQVDTWWGNLSPQEQNNPVNGARYETANTALARAGEILSAADGAINTIENSTVQFSMDKQIKDAWNFIVGAQYQLNPNLMLRFEGGFLGSRNQLIAGLQYRFGL